MSQTTLPFPDDAPNDAADAEAAELVDMVMRRAEASGALDDDELLLLLDALQGDGDVSREAASTDVPLESTPTPTVRDPATGVFITSVTVAGFRGVGPEAKLDLHPGPGLTIVAGRNGSGKSTFSEAIETALTGDSYRWRKKKTVAWQAGWRNLHTGDPCQIRVTLAEPEVSKTVVGVDWAADAKLDKGRLWVQRGADKREHSMDSLGWRRPLELYRPLLSYDELSGLLDGGPSQLYDALSTVLGLWPVAEAQARLDDVVTKARAPRLAVDKQLRVVRSQLAACPDGRAAEALTLLSASEPDIDELQRLATGTRPPQSGPIATLRGIMSLGLTDIETVTATARAYERAVEALASLADTTTEANERRIALFSHVVTHLDATPDSLPVPCPLCRVGTLDKAWLDATKAELTDLRTRTDAVRTARAAHADALTRLRNLLPELPAFMVAPTELDLPARSELVDGWSNLSERRVETLEDVRHFARSYEELSARLAKLQYEADEELARREDAWAPLAALLGQVTGELRNARESDVRARRAKSAASWLKDQANALRNERLRPIADHARRIWAELRQESNVDLGDITLSGTKAARKATLTAHVDGEEAGALGVMSQGELHALSLALFIPRAAMPASPFRFVIIDDPVQAMDPAKVDGLARVLAEIAQSRQVVVFSHDDRLPEAVRRLARGGRILHVHRSTGSRVEVVSGSDPADRHLADARAVAKDPGADARVRRHVIPILCRLAVESACRDLVFARRIRRGDTRSDVEQAWDGAKTARQHIALALRDDASADIRPWLERGNRRRDAMRVVGSSGHDGLDRDALGAVRDVEVLIKDVRADAS